MNKMITGWFYNLQLQPIQAVGDFHHVCHNDLKSKKNIKLKWWNKKILKKNGKFLLKNREKVGVFLYFLTYNITSNIMSAEKIYK